MIPMTKKTLSVFEACSHQPWSQIDFFLMLAVYDMKS